MTLVEIVGNLYVRCEMLQQEVERLQAEGAQLAAAVTALQSEATAARVAEAILNLDEREGADDGIKLKELIHAELNKPLTSPDLKPSGDETEAATFLADVKAKLAEGRPAEA